MIRWLHKTWKILLRTLVVILLTILLAGGILFGALQLPKSQAWLGEQLTGQFNEQFEGTLRFDDLGGLLPFRAYLLNVRLLPPGDDPMPVLTVRRLELHLSLWSLLQRNVTIHALELRDPVIRLEEDELGYLTIRQALQSTTPPGVPQSRRVPFGQFNLLAPGVTIYNGTLLTDSLFGDEPAPFSNHGLNASRIDGRFFLELSEQQRFLDIEYLSARFADERIGTLDLSGQLFSDQHYLELNGILLRLAGSQIAFSADATPVDLFAPDLAGQLASAEYRFEMQESRLNGEMITRFVPEWPFGGESLDLELLIQGSFESLFIDRLTGHIGSSSVLLTGQIEQINTPQLSYHASLTNLVFRPAELRTLFRELEWQADEGRLEQISESLISGHLTGDRSGIQTAWDMVSEHGAAEIDAGFQFDTPNRYEATVRLDSLNPGPFFPNQLESGLLDGRIALSGSGLTLEESSGQLTVELGEGNIDHIHFAGGRLEANWQDRRLDHNLSVRNGEQAVLRSSGWIRNADEEWTLSLDGELQRVDLYSIFPELPLPIHSLSMEYSSELRWRTLNDLFGRISLQVSESVIGPDSLGTHQLYADLNAADPDGAGRRLRLTSTFLDADIQGDIHPDNLTLLYHHWSDYFAERLSEEITLADSEAEQEEPTEPARANVGTGHPEPASLRVDLSIKDLALLQYYLEELPAIKSRSRVNLTLDAAGERVLLTGTLSDSNLQYGDFRAGEFSASLTASFRHEQRLREYATMDLRLNGRDYSWKELSFEEGFLSGSMRNDSLLIRHQTRNNGGGHRLDFTLLTRIFPENIETEIREFTFGGNEYEWRTEGTPHILYTDRQTVEIDHLLLTSGEEQIEVQGIFSNDPDEWMSYTARSVDLKRISDLIDGRVTFAGQLDGNFNTRTLTRLPVAEGRLEVRRGMLNDRLIGDVVFDSRYSSEQERFNTEISVRTDPERYPRYFAENDSIGQNLYLNGYVTIPDLDRPEDEFFYFDADLREIDTWIATVIVPDILRESEGSASGKGFVSGSLTDINFHAEFDIQNVQAVPAFLNTRYNVNGRLLFDRHIGLYFDNMHLQDSQGGTGRLVGSIDLDNFSDTNYLDLTLDLENLHFMNNPYDPDVPFYASTRGTGQARITGSNFSPYLRTTRPIVVTGGSRISVPVLNETELQQSHNFIRFVDTFDLNRLLEQESLGRQEDRVNGPGDGELLTFTERFTLDLQFIAVNPIRFQLIFDSVTNEALTANGTGQIRLSLEDQNFNLFGRMNITGGDYQFVAGDIISRRFQLLDGGSILWEGDPANARLNVEANYRARPDLTSLLTTGSPGRLEGAQRAPIDLVLHIGGTLSELENDFYFRVPSNIEGTLDPTLLTQINALNRNEEEKVIQATSLLLSGNFIPLASASSEGGTGSALRESFTGGTVVNPLITGQVINPLLSDQINSILRSDMAVDIDFNLTPYNQVDLGVALRLYDDRLILRRDGQITGPYSDIGDLGAIYRINRTFALTAFHRQDPTLSNTSTTEPRQVQEMNGVGIEAQMQFNSWKEFRRRVDRAFSWLFGRKENGETQREESDNSDDEEEILASERLIRFTQNKATDE